MRSYTINVGGHTFQIRSDADADHVKGLAEEISTRYTALEKKGPRASQDFRAMAMVAIMLLDEMRDTRSQCDEVTEKAREFAQKMIEQIDGILAGRNP